MESDLTYFGRRASEERTAALNARHAEAHRAHIQMAERYEDLVRAITATQERVGLGSSDDPLRGFEVIDPHKS
jgi:hypothetical protein